MINRSLPGYLVSVNYFALIVLLSGCAARHGELPEICSRPLVNPIVIVKDETARSEAGRLIVAALRSEGFSYDGKRFTSLDSDCYVYVEEEERDVISIILTVPDASNEAATVFDVSIRQSLDRLIHKENLDGKLQTASNVLNVH